MEIFGPESSGKDHLALNVVAQAQKMGGKAAFIDAEHAMDPEYAAKLGVNVNELLISQPDSGEEALEYFGKLGALRYDLGRCRRLRCGAYAESGT